MSDVDWSKAPVGATHAGMDGNYVQFYRIPGLLGDYDYWSETLRQGAWNEGHGKPVANPLYAMPPAWTGYGLPPVGTVCETWFDDGKACWHECEVIHHKSDDQRLAAVILRGEHKGRLSWGMDFRPIRTPEQIAAEEREKAIQAMHDIVGDIERVPTWDDALAALYDAGYRKTEAP
jgi:hypothetical protein